MKKKQVYRILLIGCCLAVLGILGYLYWASAYIDSGVYVDCLCKGPASKHSVALTFDDGPDEIMTPKVLDVLKRNNVKATFFVIGNKVKEHPDLVSRIISEGHIIGNHSLAHNWNFPFQSVEDMLYEMSECEDLVYTMTGKRMKLFRPPFGVTNPMIADAVKEKEYTCIGWSIRSFDTDNDRSRNEILSRVLRQLHNGAIILLHDRCDKADELLQLLISNLQQKNYDIVNLDTLLDIEPYRMNI